MRKGRTPTAHCWLYCIDAVHDARLLVSPSRANWPGSVYDANPDAPVNDTRFQEIRQSMTYFLFPVGDMHVMSGTRRRPLPNPRRRSSQYTSSALTLCIPHSRRYWTSRLTRQLCASVLTHARLVQSASSWSPSWPLYAPPCVRSTPHPHDNLGVPPDDSPRLGGSMVRIPTRCRSKSTIRRGDPAMVGGNVWRGHRAARRFVGRFVRQPYQVKVKH